MIIRIGKEFFASFRPEELPATGVWFFEMMLPDVDMPIAQRLASEVSGISLTYELRVTQEVVLLGKSFDLTPVFFLRGFMDSDREGFKALLVWLAWAQSQIKKRATDRQVFWSGFLGGTKVIVHDSWDMDESAISAAEVQLELPA